MLNIITCLIEMMKMSHFMYDRFRLAIAVLMGASLPGLTSATPAEGVDPKVRSFLDSYCISCHGPQTQRADFRVDTRLKLSETPADAEYWQLVLDHLNLGTIRLGG